MGSIGIWLPIGIEALIEKKVTYHNIPPNVTTYFMTILFAGCIDYFLSRIRQLNNSGIASIFMSLIMLVLVSIILVISAVISSIYGKDNLALIIALVGVILGYRIWWLANNDNQNFNPESTLGDNPERTLSDGN